MLITLHKTGETQLVIGKSCILQGASIQGQQTWPWLNLLLPVSPHPRRIGNSLVGLTTALDTEMGLHKAKEQGCAAYRSWRAISAARTQKSRHTHIVFGGMVECGSLGQTLKRVSRPQKQQAFLFFSSSLDTQVLFRLVFHHHSPFWSVNRRAGTHSLFPVYYIDNYNPFENSDCVVESSLSF
jgi:hypothetical protein